MEPQAERGGPRATAVVNRSNVAFLVFSQPVTVRARPLGERLTSHFIHPATNSFELGFTVEAFNEDGLLDLALTHGGVQVLLGRP